MDKAAATYEGELAKLKEENEQVRKTFEEKTMENFLRQQSQEALEENLRRSEQ